MRRGLTWPWIRMRPLLARFSEPVWSGHLPFWADFITTTSGFRFSVHTAVASAFAFPCARSKAWIEGFSSTHSTMAFSGGATYRPTNVGGFGRKVRVVALTPGLASREVNLVAA